MTKVITMIQAQKRRGRYNVYLNGHYAFPVGASVLVYYRLRKGMPISRALRRQLTAADQIAKLYRWSVNWLSRGLKPASELRRRLYRRSTDKTAIDRVIRKLITLQLLDDRKYANLYVQNKVDETTQGPKLIAQRLARKGIGSVLIHRALARFYPQSKVMKNGVKRAQVLFSGHSDPFRRNLQKTRTGLIRRGYSFDQTDQIIARARLAPDPAGQRRLLIRMARSAWRRYHRFPVSERAYRVRGRLYRKGFSGDEIDVAVAKLTENS